MEKTENYLLKVCVFFKNSNQAIEAVQTCRSCTDIMHTNNTAARNQPCGVVAADSTNCSAAVNTSSVNAFAQTCMDVSMLLQIHTKNTKKAFFLNSFQKHPFAKVHKNKKSADKKLVQTSELKIFLIITAEFLAWIFYSEWKLEGGNTEMHSAARKMD